MSRSCSVAFPSLSRDEVQNQVLIRGDPVSPVPKMPTGLHVQCCRGVGPGFCGGPTSTPLTVSLSSLEYNSPFPAYLFCTAQDLSKCCVNARPPYDNSRIKN